MDSGAKQHNEREALKIDGGDGGSGATATNTQRPASRGIRAICRIIFRYGTSLGTLALALVTAALVYVTWQQVGLARRQLELSDAHNRRSARAYVLFESGRIERQGEQYKITLRVKNSGQTPAYNVRHSWGMRVYDFPLPLPKPFGPITFTPVDERQSVDIGAGGSFELDDLARLPVTRSDKGHINARTKAVYVWAKLEYRDTFQGVQCTNFAAVNFRDEREQDGKSGWDLRVLWHEITDDVRSECPKF